MKLELRPLQLEGFAKVQAAFRDGHKRVMACAPCGFGKTELGTAFLQATYNNGRGGGFMADRIALVEQTSERFDKYGLPHGIMQAKHPRYRPSERIQVMSEATVRRRQMPPGSLLLIDEAHNLTEFQKALLSRRDRYAIGLSATPVTRSLGNYFDTVVNLATVNQLIELGWLVPVKGFSYEQPDLEGVPTNAKGEFDDKKTEKRVLQIVGDVVQNYLEHGNEEQFILFAWNIAHAVELRRQFIAAGINTATYTADDRPEDRHESVQEFKRGPGSTIRGLISVSALTRGFDYTGVKLLIDCHPFRKAWWEYVQMLGRVQRPHAGATEARVFDHSGNFTHFWHDWRYLFEHGVAELDDGTAKPKDKGREEKEPDPRTCPQCKNTHLPRPVCPHCGFEYPKAGAPEAKPGTLKEVIASNDKEFLRSKLWPMLCAVAAGTSTLKNDADRHGRALMLYRGLTGQYPPRDQHYSNTMRIEPTAEVRGQAKSLLIRRAKGYAKGAS